MPLSLIEGALGGIGLFLLGMRLMSDGIRTVADARVRRIFSLFTSNRLYSLLFGIAMSMAVNSGSAAVIFTIGLVNGGVLNAFQAMSVLGGILIGASLTLHLHIIPHSLIATPLVFIGVLLKFFARRRRMANAGDLLLGVGLLFLGLTLLEGSYRPIDHHPLYELFSGIFYRMTALAAVFGAVVSFLVQSAASTIAIIASLMNNHQISDASSAAMVAGGLVGVAVMGNLASVGGNFISRRVAVVFFTLSLIVGLLFVLLSPLLADGTIPGFSAIAGNNGKELFSRLAWLHTIVSMCAAICCVALSGPVSRLLASSEGADHTNHGVDSAQPCASYLDLRIINTPTIAIEQARKEVVRMMSVTSFMFGDVREILFEFDSRRAETIRQHEKVLDSLNHEITSYLALLSRSTKSPEISYEIPGLLQTVTVLEHIGDRCEEVLDDILARKVAGVIFSDDAMADLKSLIATVGDVMTATEDTVRSGQPISVEDLHQIKLATRSSFDRVKQAHFDRISSGVCLPQAMMLFNNMSSAIVAIAELCWSILGMPVRRAE
ncbi:MAG: Na/Pi cotransporter family protein [Desulfuromonadales bacterium]|nr:Na/Pi cotransporter family protein [Desulfuromonadales bacterium]